MNEQQRKVMELALEALHGFIPYLPLKDEAQCGRYDKALTALREALEQLAQRRPLTHEQIYSVLENLQVRYNYPPTTDSRIIFARAIEAAHGIKE